MQNSQRKLSGIPLIKVDGRYFSFDLKKICEFITKKTGENSREREILDSYEFGDEGNKRQSSKTIRELTVPGGNGQENIVYDLIKIFIIQVVAFDSERSDIEIEDLPFGTKIAFNTLITEGFLYELK